MIEALWDHLFEKLSLYLDDYLPLERVPEPGHDIHLVTTSTWSRHPPGHDIQHQKSLVQKDSSTAS